MTPGKGWTEELLPNTCFSFIQTYSSPSSAPFHNSNAKIANYICFCSSHLTPPTWIWGFFEKDQVSRSSIFHLQLPSPSYKALK